MKNEEWADAVALFTHIASNVADTMTRLFSHKETQAEERNSSKPLQGGVGEGFTYSGSP